MAKGLGMLKWRHYIIKTCQFKKTAQIKSWNRKLLLVTTNTNSRHLPLRRSSRFTRLATCTHRTWPKWITLFYKHRHSRTIWLANYLEGVRDRNKFKWRLTHQSVNPQWISMMTMSCPLTSWLKKITWTNNLMCKPRKTRLSKAGLEFLLCKLQLEI